MKITLVIDNPQSWIVPYIQKLRHDLSLHNNVVLVHQHHQIGSGDVAVFLSCEKKISPQTLSLNHHNLVVHESRLPKGRGWSPVTWQILEGKSKITVTLFEANQGFDTGPIYAQSYFTLQGHELINEIRRKQASVTFKLVKRFLNKHPHNQSQSQSGSPTYYRKRTPKDNQFDINQSLRQQFNLLRVVDNDRYPAFFIHKGKKYFLKISKHHSK